MNRSRQMRIRRMVARNRHRPTARRLATAARMYLMGFENVDWEMSVNGEARVMSVVLHGQPKPIVVDVGANLGEWTAAVRVQSPSAEIHCIEIVPYLAESLRRRWKDDRGIHVHSVGLLDRSATVSVSSSPDRPELSHIMPDIRPSGDGDDTVEAEVMTGDDWLAANDVTHVDLLKIDVEGFDYDVLLGFSKSLDAGIIDVIQFEYTRAATARGVTLGDVHAVLTAHGYTVGKLYPGGVRFAPYSAQRDEDMPGMNYLAVAQASGQLVPSLRGNA